MPYKELEIKNGYLTIGDVSEMFGINASQIRFYEREFDILRPQKDKKGNRLFAPGDIANLRTILHLVKEKGYTLQGARDYLQENEHKDREKQQIIESLERLKAFLQELRDDL